MQLEQEKAEALRQAQQQRAQLEMQNQEALRQAEQQRMELARRAEAERQRIERESQQALSKAERERLELEETMRQEQLRAKVNQIDITKRFLIILFRKHLDKRIQRCFKRRLSWKINCLKKTKKFVLSNNV